MPYPSSTAFPADTIHPGIALPLEKIGRGIMDASGHGISRHAFDKTGKAVLDASGHGVSQIPILHTGRGILTAVGRGVYQRPKSKLGKAILRCDGHAGKSLLHNGILTSGRGIADLSGEGSKLVNHIYQKVNSGILVLSGHGSTAFNFRADKAGEGVLQLTARGQAAHTRTKAGRGVLNLVGFGDKNFTRPTIKVGKGILNAAGEGSKAGVLQLIAEISGRSDLTLGEILVERRLGAILLGDSTIGLDLAVTHPLIASIAGASVVTAKQSNPRVSHTLGATSAGTSTLAGGLGFPLALAATISTTSSISPGPELTVSLTSFLGATINGRSSVLGWLSVPDFPLGITTRPPNIEAGLLILADHVGKLWDEVVSIEAELKGNATGQLTLDLRPPGVGDSVLASRQRVTDSQSRFSLTAAGKMAWGSGSAATDLTLERANPRLLRVTGSAEVLGQSASEVPLTVRGSASQTADYLSIQDNASSPIMRLSSTGRLRLPTSGVLAGLELGGDATLYRAGGSIMRTDATFQHGANVVMVGDHTINLQDYSATTQTALQVKLTSDNANRFEVTGGGQLRFGPGTGASDVQVQRGGTSTLQVSGHLSIVNSLTVGEALTVSGTANFVSSTFATTPAQDNNTTLVATTQWVMAQSGNTTPQMDGTGVAGSSLRWSRMDHVHPTDTTRSPINSPTFTGSVQAPTPPVGSNNQLVATTEFVQGSSSSSVQAQAGVSFPLMDGTAAVGSATVWSREDHRHPTDNTRSPVTNPTFVGQVLVPIGTSSAPGLAFSTDANTGIFSQTADLLSISAGGTLSMAFVAGQSLAPTSAGAAAPGYSFQGATSTGVFGTSSIIGFSIGGTEFVRMNSAGQMIIVPQSSGTGISGGNTTGLRLGNLGPVLYRATSISSGAVSLDADSFNTSTVQAAHLIATTDLVAASTTLSSLNVSGTLGTTGVATLGKGSVVLTDNFTGAENTTRVASTAQVKLAMDSRLANSTADNPTTVDSITTSRGTLTTFARADHKHMLPLSFPVITYDDATAPWGINADGRTQIVTGSITITGNGSTTDWVVHTGFPVSSIISLFVQDGFYAGNTAYAVRGITNYPTGPTGDNFTVQITSFSSGLPLANGAQKRVNWLLIGTTELL